MSKEPLEYTVHDLREVLGEVEDWEISDLINGYPSYQIKNWRLTLLEGLKQGNKNDKILAEKLKAKNVDPDSYQSRGGHTRMIDNKIRRAAIRLLFLRYRREGMTKRQANAAVWKQFPDLTQNAIAYNTRKR